MGGRWLLPSGRRSRLRAPAHGGRLRPARPARRRDRRRERDRRRAGRVRACGQEPRAWIGHGRGRRPRLGGDDAAARACLRRGSPPYRGRARQPATAGEDGRRARRDGACVPHGRTGDGGRHAARAAGCHDVGAHGGGRAPASTGRLSDAFLRDAHLHGCWSGQPRQPRRECCWAAPGGSGGAVRLRRGRGRLLLGLRAHRRRRRGVARATRRARRDARGVRGRPRGMSDRAHLPGT